jgi:integrase
MRVNELKKVGVKELDYYKALGIHATLELIENRTDIHTLSKQIGNIAAMIERHYCKLTRTIAASRLV